MIRKIPCVAKGPESIGFKKEIGTQTSFMQKLQPDTKRISLMDSNGGWQDEETKIEEIVVDYHKDLFTTSNPIDFTELLNAVRPNVSPSMN